MQGRVVVFVASYFSSTDVYMSCVQLTMRQLRTNLLTAILDDATMRTLGGQRLHRRHLRARLQRVLGRQLQRCGAHRARAVLEFDSYFHRNA